MNPNPQRAPVLFISLPVFQVSMPHRLDTAGALALVDYRRLAPHAERAHPTEEHFLPLLVALGASQEADAAQRVPGDITYGVLSMDSYVWRMDHGTNQELAS